MYLYRVWHPADIPWLDQACAACAWESLSPAERVGASAGEVVSRAQQRMRLTLGSAWGTLLVAQLGGMPVGYVLVGVIPDGATEELQGYLLDLWVDPAHRRRGVGYQLQRLAEDLLAGMGLRKIKLWSGVHNRSFLNLARRLGYAPEGVIGLKVL